MPEEINGHRVLGWEFRFDSFEPSNFTPNFSMAWGRIPQFGMMDPYRWTYRVPPHQTPRPPGFRRFFQPLAHDYTRSQGSQGGPGLYYFTLSSSVSTPLQVRWSSRALGYAGSGFPLEVHPLDFHGGVATGSLPPSETAFYYVDVPPGATSWQVSLETTAAGQVALSVVDGWDGPMTELFGSAQFFTSGFHRIRFEKQGGQHFTLFPYSGETTLRPGRVFLVVVGEGADSPPEGTLGTGDAPFTLTSKGEAPIVDLGVAPAAGIVRTASFPAGGHAYFRLRAGADTDQLRLRVRGLDGSVPYIGIREGTAFPTLFSGDGGYGTFSGTRASADTRLSLSNTAGKEFAIVVGYDGQPEANPGGAFELTVEPLGDTTEHVDSRQLDRSDEVGPGDWLLFRTSIPADVGGQPLLGWEIRVNSWTGAPPRLYLRRGLPPSTNMGAQIGVTTTSFPEGAYLMDRRRDWTTTQPWTEVETSPGWQPGSYIINVPGGQPLQAGEYYIGFHNESGTAATFEWSSRWIGGLASGMPIEVTPLAASNGQQTLHLHARESTYFYVDIGAGVPSWRISLDDPESLGSALFVRAARIPDFRFSTTANNMHFSAASQLRNDRPGSKEISIFPELGETHLRPGRYFIQVHATAGGAGLRTFTLRQSFPVPMTHLGTLETGRAVSLEESYEAGKLQVFQVDVPPGTGQLRFHLEGLSGFPRLTGRAGPNPPWFRQHSHTPSDSFALFSREEPDYAGSGTIVVNEPPAGRHTFVVGHSHGGVPVGSDPHPPGSFRLTLEIPGVPTIQPDGGGEWSQVAVGDWDYYRAEIPAMVNGWPVRGWELRIEEWKTNRQRPEFYLRRGIEPTAVSPLPRRTPAGTTMAWGDQIQSDSDWVVRAQSAASPGWPAQKRFTLPVGSTVVPGTYFFGMRVPHSWNSGEYRWTSTLIGDEGSGLGREIRSVAFAGGSASGRLEPRETAYHVVEIPPNVPSWRGRVALPPGHDVSVRIRHGDLPVWPSFLAAPSAAGFSQLFFHRDGAEVFDIFPPPGEAFLVPGRYYVAVISEGANPPSSGIAGDGPVDYVFHSEGAFRIPHLGTIPAGGLLAHTVQANGDGTQFLRFDVPAGMRRVRVQVPEPPSAGVLLGLRRGGDVPAAVSGDFPRPVGWMASQVGHWAPLSSHASGFNALILENPGEGTHTLTIARPVTAPGTPPSPPTPFPIRIFADPPVHLGHTERRESHRLELAAGETAIISVTPPATFAGESVLGWKVWLKREDGGLAEHRVRRDGGSTYPHQFRHGARLVPAEMLNGASWDVELRASAAGNHTLVSELLTLDSLERAPWAMPVAGASPPGRFFADTALGPNGQPIPGGPGRALAAGDFHLYAVDVPAGNGGLLVTRLQSQSGEAFLWMEPFRLTAFPTFSSTQAQGGRSAPFVLLRERQVKIAHWSQADEAIRDYLDPGLWFIGVYAGDEPASYRLEMGDFHPQIVTDLPGGAGEVTNQTLASADWHYFRWHVPEDPREIPREWILDLSWSQPMEVVIRDTLPPGEHGFLRDYPTAAGQNMTFSGGGGLQNPGGRFHTVPGRVVLSGRDLRPGRTHYIGVRAHTVGQFSLRATPSAETLQADFPEFAELPVDGGRATLTLEPGERRLWRVRSPAEFNRWHHAAVHDARIRLHLRRDFLPSPGSSLNNWSSNGQSDSRGTVPFYDQIPRASDLYLLAENTAAEALPLDLVVQPRQFTIARDEAGDVGYSPTIWYFPNKQLYDYGDTVTLQLDLPEGFRFLRWAGTLSGTERPLVVRVEGDIRISVEVEVLDIPFELSAENGRILADPPGPEVPTGSIVELTAVPDPGYRFIRWEGVAALYREQNPIQYPIFANTSIRAVFWPDLPWEAVGLKGVPIRMGGAVPWVRADDKARPGRAVAIASPSTLGSDNWFSAELEGPGILIYWRKIEASPGAEFYFSSLLGQEPNEVVWEASDWAPVRVEIPPGNHTVRWNLDAYSFGANALLDEIVYFPAGQATTFEGWYGRYVVDPERRGPYDLTPVSAVPQLLAFAMGIDPLERPSPGLLSVMPGAPENRLYLTHRHNPGALGVSVQYWVSHDVGPWQRVEPLEPLAILPGHPLRPQARVVLPGSPSARISLVRIEVVFSVD